MKSGWITAVFIGVIVVGGLAYVFLRGGDGPQLGQQAPEPAATEAAESTDAAPAPSTAEPGEAAAGGEAIEGTEPDTAAAGDQSESAAAPADATASEASGQEPTGGQTGAGADAQGSNEPAGAEQTADQQPASETASEATAAGGAAQDGTGEADSAETGTSEKAATTPGSADSTAAESATAPAQETAETSNGEPADGQEQLAARSDETGQPQGPTFDVVRVERTGEAVIAGWAPPGSRVTLYDGADALGTVTADGSGNWVLLPDAPLGAGSRELYLTAKTPAGQLVESADSVVVVVPDAKPAGATPSTETAVAGAATGQAGGEALEQGGTDTATSTVTGETSTESQASTDAGNLEAASTDPVTEDSLADSGETASGESSGALAVLVPRQGQGASRVLQEPSEDEGITDQDLVLNAIDYDQSGRVVISGRALPGARILVYLDNALVGQTQADAQKRWVVSPSERIEPGLHRLRVDQVDEGGAVMARVETPFSRAESLTDLPGENFVIVQPGNSLWRIARKTYGDGFRFSLIYRSNQEQIRDPDLIYPGQVFLVPGSEAAPVN